MPRHQRSLLSRPAAKSYVGLRSFFTSPIIQNIPYFISRLADAACGSIAGRALLYKCIILPARSYKVVERSCARGAGSGERGAGRQRRNRARTFERKMSLHRRQGRWERKMLAQNRISSIFFSPTFFSLRPCQADHGNAVPSLTYDKKRNFMTLRTMPPWKLNGEFA